MNVCYFRVGLLFSIIALGCHSKEQSRFSPSVSQSPVSEASPQTSVANLESDASPQAKLDAVSSFKATFSSAAAGGKVADSTKHFIRTAALRFLTKDVLTTTIAIENIALGNEGFVVKNHLEHDLQRIWTTPISEDSTLETKTFKVSNMLTIRIPWQRLDTTLRLIGKWAESLDYRRIDARDISLEQLEHDLDRLRNLRFEDQVNEDIAEKGRQLNSVSDARERALRSRVEADAAHIQNLKLADEVRYSTIQVEIYQRETIQTMLLPREKTVLAYRPSILTQLGGAVLSGWQILASVLIGMVSIWPLLLLIMGAYFGYKKWVSVKISSKRVT